MARNDPRQDTTPPKGSAPERTRPKKDLDPEQVWDEHLARHKESPEAIRSAVEALVRAKKFDHAAGLLKAAIRRGLGEPWMYEALALALEASGADKDEIQRTLLSAADVISDSPDAQFRVARMLGRHGLQESAIRLYREAAEKAPTAPEPYVESLELAAPLNDATTVRWAATHLLSQGWVNVQDDLYRKARGHASAVAVRLRAQGRSKEADELAQAVHQADNRDLVVRMTWQGEADLDLHVLEPLGTVCSPQNRVTPAGGVLVHDGYGKDVGSEKNPAELYVCARALPGSYEIRCELIWGRPIGDRVKIEVTRQEGSASEKKESVYVRVPSEKPLIVKLDAGRRTHLMLTPSLSSLAGASPLARLPIQQLRDAMAAQGGGRYDGPEQLFQVGGARVAGGAVAFEPVVTQFFNGASLSAQPVVSADRRYVRLNLTPVFTNLIGSRRFVVSGAAGGGRGGGFP